MPAPDFATLYDFETPLENAFALAIDGVLAAAGITLTVNQTQESDTRGTPSVQLSVAIGGPVERKVTTAGQLDPKHITPNAFEFTLQVWVSTTRPVDTDNAELHGPIRGWVRYALSAGGKKIPTGYLPYWQIMDMLPAGCTPQLQDEKQQDVTELKYQGKFSIREDAWPAETVTPPEEE